MTNITYTEDIPNPPNDPSVDAPVMQQNTNAVATLLEEDHYGFNDNDGGEHQFVRIPNHVTPSSPDDAEDSSIYTATSAVSGKANLLFQNQNATYLLSSIKAMGIITVTGSNSATIAGYNLVGTATKVGDIITFALSANVAPGSTPIFLNSAYLSGNRNVASFSYSDPTVTLTLSGSSSSGTIHFALLEL